jgi:hypothetical protein
MKTENIRIDLTVILFIGMYIFETLCITNSGKLAN